MGSVLSFAQMTGHCGCGTLRTMVSILRLVLHNIGLSLSLITTVSCGRLQKFVMCYVTLPMSLFLVQGALLL